MSRRLRPEEQRLWAVVASTVRPAAGRSAPEPPVEAKPEAKAAPIPAKALAAAPSAAATPRRSPAVKPPPADIEPGRKRRIARGRDSLELMLDLHGLDQDRAKAALVGFLIRAHAEGERAVLVITGKGAMGDGVLRRRVPDWLSDPSLAQVVAGWSEAHRRHGGQGALYVALKRRPV